MDDQDTPLLRLRELVEAFVEERDWRQFHNPKDLSAAISIEAAELLELFLWKTADEVTAATQQEAVKAKMEDELCSHPDLLSEPRQPPGYRCNERRTQEIRRKQSEVSGRESPRNQQEIYSALTDVRER